MGIKSPEDLVNYRPDELCDKLEHMHIIQARKLIKSAKVSVRWNDQKFQISFAIDTARGKTWNATRKCLWNWVHIVSRLLK